MAIAEGTCEILPADLVSVLRWAIFVRFNIMLDDLQCDIWDIIEINKMKDYSMTDYSLCLSNRSEIEIPISFGATTVPPRPQRLGNIIT